MFYCGADPPDPLSRLNEPPKRFFELSSVPFLPPFGPTLKQTPLCEAPLHSATSLLPHLLIAPKRKTAAACSHQLIRKSESAVKWNSLIIRENAIVLEPKRPRIVQLLLILSYLHFTQISMVFMPDQVGHNGDSEIPRQARNDRDGVAGSSYSSARQESIRDSRAAVSRCWPMKTILFMRSP